MRKLLFALVLIAPMYAQTKDAAVSEVKLTEQEKMQVENLNLRLNNVWLTFQKQQADYQRQIGELNGQFTGKITELMQKYKLDPKEWGIVGPTNDGKVTEWLFKKVEKKEGK